VVFESLENPSSDPNGHPQGLAIVAHVNYWERFLAAPEILPEESDQTILRIVRAATQADEADLVPVLQLLEHPRLWRAVNLFGANHFTTAHVTRLLQLLVERRKNEVPTTWPGYLISADEPPGLNPLYNLARDLQERGQLDGQSLVESLEKAFEQAIPANLPLADELEHWFVIAADVRHWFDEPTVSALKAKFRKTLYESYVRDADKLARALTGCPPYLLMRLSWGLDRLRDKAFDGVPFAGWAEFARTMLESARRAPAIMLPQVASFVVRRVAMSDRTDELKFDRASAARLFGESELRAVFTVESVATLDRESRVVAEGLERDQ
jgi:hypothetical protein